jgi:pimeloyl-ACP methyl ester carboxylesterase
MSFLLFFFIILGRRWGSKDRNSIPVLVIHGAFDTSSTFDRLIPLLPQQNFYYLSIDLPGHGHSSHFPRGTTYLITDYVLVIRRIFNYFSWQQIQIIGHSFGAFIAGFFAAFYPDNVSKLVILDAVCPKVVETENTISILRSIEKVVLKNNNASELPQYTYEEALIRLKKRRSTLLTDEAAKTVLLRSLVKTGEFFSFSIDRQFIGATYPILTYAQICEIYSNVKCNVLIICAEDSKPYTRKEHTDVLEILKISCKTFQFLYVPGNHDMHVNNPEVVAPHITKFFYRQSNL